MVEKNDLRTLLREAVTAVGFVWVGHEYIPSRYSAVLRVYIDKKEGGITVDDCARVSRHLSTVLQVADNMRGRYFLEISSPGINRPLFELEQYRAYIGSTLKLRLDTDVEGQKNMRVVLRAVGDSDIVVELGEKEFCVPFSMIKRANLQTEE